ncbi:MAG: UDP-glucose/GDP-mannose dehydrogenase family protein [Thaumarchaeota archaeon]|nr:UDP-glucose/GDP-mannose dehydrogenase family protein [Nitrososphaerota archaeon]
MRLRLPAKHSVAIVGLGFVGLSTAVCFAKLGIEVLGIDLDRRKIALIAKGRVPFHEPNLDRLLQETTNASFQVSTNVKLIARSPIIFIVVGTPSKEDGSMDDRYLRSAARDVGSAIKGSKSYPLIVVKSTVVPGTLLNLVIPEIEKTSGLKYGKGFGACSNPEFLREGSAIEDTLKPDRIIIGGSKKDAITLQSFYAKTYGKSLPKTIMTNPHNAELIKYANNAFLAMKISFANSLARLCEKLPEGDVNVIAEGVGLDRRIGSLFLRAGLGFGGSCFPKDVRAFIEFSKKLGYAPPLAEATMQINKIQPLRAVEMAEDKIGSLKGKKVALLGLTFKPDTDDMREAVSIRIVDELLKKGARVYAHDPKALETASSVFGKKIKLVSSAKECLKGADCAILVTEWKDYLALKPRDFKSLMKNPIVIDGRRLFDAEEFSKALDYAAIGLGKRSS